MIKVYWTRSYPKHEDLMKMGLNPKAMMSGLRIRSESLFQHPDYKEFLVRGIPTNLLLLMI